MFILFTWNIKGQWNLRNTADNSDNSSNLNETELIHYYDVPDRFHEPAAVTHPQYQL